MKLQDIAQALSASVIGDATLAVERIVHPADAVGPGDLAVAISDETFAALNGCKAEAVVIAAKSPPPVDRFRAIIVANQQRATLAILTRLFDAGPVRAPGIHPTAVIADDAVLEPDVSIGPFVVVGPGSRVGANTVLMAHTVVGANVTIGRDGLFHVGVRITDRVQIGDRVLVQANAVIGSDGFGFIPVGPAAAGADPGSSHPLRLHSLGTVVVEDDVEIGAGTTIDRATMTATRIGRGTKIDNLVQIGHNVTIGEDCLICGMSGISGSVKIGDRVLIGGGAGIADHVTIGSDASVAAGSGVGSNVPPGTRVSGYPAMRHERTAEHVVYLGRQKALHARVADLQSRLELLEKALKREGS